jgi:uncharacterized protein (TIGR03067 family)
MIRAELAGELAPELVTAKTVLEFSAGEYRVLYAGEIHDRGSVRVVSATEPRQAVLHGILGPNAGRTIPCIFQLVGDRLRINYGLDGGRPTEFRGAADGSRYLAIYRRIAAD